MGSRKMLKCKLLYQLLSCNYFTTRVEHIIHSHKEADDVDTNAAKNLTQQPNLIEQEADNKQTFSSREITNNSIKAVISVL